MKIPVKVKPSGPYKIPVKVIPTGYMSDAEHDKLMQYQADAELSQEYEPDEY